MEWRVMIWIIQPLLIYQSSPSHHLVISPYRPRLVLIVSSLLLVAPSRPPIVIYRLVSRLVYRLAVASRFLSSSFLSVPLSYPSSLISRPLIYPLITTSLPFPIASRIVPYHRIAFSYPCYGQHGQPQGSEPDARPIAESGTGPVNDTRLIAAAAGEHIRPHIQRRAMVEPRAGPITGFDRHRYAIGSIGQRYDCKEHRLHFPIRRKDDRRGSSGECRGTRA